MEFWPFLLLGLGLVFVILEVFIPSAGILGSLAAVAIVTGAVLAWRGDGSIFRVYLLLAALLVPATMLVGLKLFPHTPIGRRMTLSGSTFTAREASAGGEEFESLRDARGIAATTLRPSGKATLNGERVDVVTRGELIERGRPVRVIRVEGNRVFVAEETNSASLAAEQRKDTP